MRKKYRIKNSGRFICFVSCVLLLCVFVGGAALGFFNVASKDNISYTAIEVSHGDTLWNIAKLYGPKDADIRETVYKICKLNNVSADTLRAGQVISVPN